MNISKILLVFILFFGLPCYAMGGDFLADKIPKTVKKPEANLNYNYFDTEAVPITLNITKQISTRNKNLYEGKILKFEVLFTVEYNGKVIVRRGDIIKGKVKYLVSSGLNGIPHSITLGDFQIPNIPQKKLVDEYEKRGKSKTPMVLPLKWALTCLPPTGSFTNFIKGGHAKIKTDEDIVIYYYPNWAN